MYFAFLATYTRSLTPIAVLGATFHFLGERYSPLYSIVIVLWATFFAEYWAVCERKLAIRWGTHGSSGFNELPTNQIAGTWWIVDFGKLSRLAVSVAALLGFICVLAAITVVVFVLEAFLAVLYKGPGSQLAVCAISLSPARKVDVINLACPPSDHLRRECPSRAGYLSVHCHPQHRFRTARHLLRLHVLINDKAICIVDNRLILRHRPFRVHLYAIWPRSPWIASPPTFCVRLDGNDRVTGRGGRGAVVGA